MDAAQNKFQPDMSPLEGNCEAPNEPLPCKDCDKSFEDHQSLRRHRDDAHLHTLKTTNEQGITITIKISDVAKNLWKCHCGIFEAEGQGSRAKLSKHCLAAHRPNEAEVPPQPPKSRRSGREIKPPKAPAVKEHAKKRSNYWKSAEEKARQRKTSESAEEVTPVEALEQGESCEHNIPTPGHPELEHQADGQDPVPAAWWQDSTAPEWMAKKGLKIYKGINAVICITCNTAVCWDELTRHMKSFHKATEAPTAKEVSALEPWGLWGSKSSFHDHLPSKPVAPFPDLPTAIGFKCNLCESPPVVAGSMGTIRSHMEDTHSFYGTVSQFVRENSETCAVQRFNKFNAKYFKVHKLLDANPAVSPDFYAFFQKLLSEKKQDIDTDRSFISPTSKRDIDPWLQSLGWAQIIDGCNPKEIKALIDLDTEVPTENRIRRLVLRYFQEIEKAVPTLNSVVLRWLLSKTRDISHRPFTTVQEEGTTQRYSLAWARMVCMLVRAVEEQHKSFKIPMSTQVEKAAKKISSALAGSEGDTQMLVHLHQLLFRLSSTWREELDSDRMACPVARYILLDCLRIEGGGCRFRDPLDMATRCAPIQYGFRIIILKEALLRKCPEQPLLESLQSIRKYIIEENITPFHTFQVVFTHAKFHLRHSQPMPNMMWSDDGERLTIGPDIVTIGGVKKFISDLFKDMEDQFTSSVLRGVPMELFKDQIQSKMDDLRDDVRCQTYGYSFLNEEKNGFVDESFMLLKAFMSQDFAVPGQFHTSADPENPEFNPVSIREWFADVESFLETLMVLCHILCGAPARGTEMANMRTRNTETRGRNCFWMDGLFTLVGRYNKSSSLTGLDKLVARALPPELGVFITIYLAYIRPLEIYWAPIAFPDHDDAVSIYNDYLWVSKGMLWDSDRVSKILKKKTATGLDCAMGLSKWRQVAIAILRRHLNITHLDEQHLPEYIEDYQAGHTPYIANVHYARDHDTIATDSPRLFRQFLNASELWHEFLGYGAGRKPSHDIHHRDQSTKEILQDTLEAIRTVSLKLDTLRAEVAKRVVTDQVQAIPKFSQMLADLHEKVRLLTSHVHDEGSAPNGHWTADTSNGWDVVCSPTVGTQPIQDVPISTPEVTEDSSPTGYRPPIIQPQTSPVMVPKDSGYAIVYAPTQKLFGNVECPKCCEVFKRFDTYVTHDCEYVFKQLLPLEIAVQIRETRKKMTWNERRGRVEENPPRPPKDTGRNLAISTPDVTRVASPAVSSPIIDPQTSPVMVPKDSKYAIVYFPTQKPYGFGCLKCCQEFRRLDVHASHACNQLLPLDIAAQIQEICKKMTPNETLAQIEKNPPRPLKDTGRNLANADSRKPLATAGRASTHINPTAHTSKQTRTPTGIRVKPATTRTATSSLSGKNATNSTLGIRVTQTTVRRSTGSHHSRTADTPRGLNIGSSPTIHTQPSVEIPTNTRRETTNRIALRYSSPKAGPQTRPVIIPETPCSRTYSMPIDNALATPTMAPDTTLASQSPGCGLSPTEALPVLEYPERNAITARPIKYTGEPKPERSSDLPAPNTVSFGKLECPNCKSTFRTHRAYYSHVCKELRPSEVKMQHQEIDEKIIVTTPHQIESTPRHPLKDTGRNIPTSTSRERLAKAKIPAIHISPIIHASKWTGMPTGNRAKLATPRTASRHAVENTPNSKLRIRDVQTAAGTPPKWRP